MRTRAPAHPRTREQVARLGVTPVRIDRFETADGRSFERHVVDLGRKDLVPAGPVPAAAAA